MKRTTSLVVIHTDSHAPLRVYSNRPSALLLIHVHGHPGPGVAVIDEESVNKLKDADDFILASPLVLAAWNRLTTPRAKKIRFPGIGEHSRLLGVTRHHLYRVLLGQRPGISLLKRYRELLIQEQRKK